MRLEVLEYLLGMLENATVNVGHPSFDEQIHLVIEAKAALRQEISQAHLDEMIIEGSESSEDSHSEEEVSMGYRGQ